MVKITIWTAVRSGSATMRRVASIPSRRGMRMSMSITSGRARAATLDCLLAVGGFAHNVDVFLGVEQRSEPGPYQLLVVDQGNTDHRAVPSRGSHAFYPKPATGSWSGFQPAAEGGECLINGVTGSALYE